MTAYGYPSVIDVEPLDNFELLLKFENNEYRIFDAKPMLAGKEGTWLGQLLDPVYFSTVRVNERIKTIEWPDEQDICPDCLYEDSKPASLLIVGIVRYENGQKVYEKKHFDDIPA